MTKKYITAPLPFQGQKRRFVNDFRNALKHFDGTEIFVDLFGGSGLLSYIAKQVYPDAKVVYNDFDDYHIRIKNIDRTNCLLRDIRNLTTECLSEKKIPDNIKDKIIDRCKIEERVGFVDYITLSASVLFSGNYVTNINDLIKSTLYNNVIKKDYITDGYLDGLEIVKLDYNDLYTQYKDIPNVTFFVDPPYLSTDVASYKCYWKLGQYLDVLNVLQGNSFFYFTSSKSSILELCEWMEKNTNINNPFRGVIKKSVCSSINYNSSYNDIMLYRKNR